MKITPIVTGDRPFMANLYKYNYWKVLVFIATDGSESTDTDDPYLSRFPDNYYNVYICLFFHPFVLVGYFNACNAKDNHNGMWQSEPALEKYLVTQGGHFILAAE